jgi:YidC/Oxa1 family membrane protein insertase
MNNQKLFLGIAIFLTVFILWDKWQITRTTDANGNIVSKTEITLGAPTSNSDVPMVDMQEAKVDIPTLSGTHTGGFTTVTTEVARQQVIT